jgi:hypothetical protein
VAAAQPLLSLHRIADELAVQYAEVFVPAADHRRRSSLVPPIWALAL